MVVSVEGIVFRCEEVCKWVWPLWDLGLNKWSMDYWVKTFMFDFTHIIVPHHELQLSYLMTVLPMMQLSHFILPPAPTPLLSSNQENQSPHPHLLLPFVTSPTAILTFTSCFISFLHHWFHNTYHPNHQRFLMSHQYHP